MHVIMSRAGYLKHIDDMRQVILRIAKGKRASQFTRLLAIGFYLCQQTLLIELVEILVHHLSIAHIFGISNNLHIVCC